MSGHSAPASSLSTPRDGNLQDIVNKGSLHDFLVGLHQEFGPVASYWFGRRPVVSLGALEQLQQHINPNHSSESCTSSMVSLVPQVSQLSPQLSPSTADSFETMLKSLLGYQSGLKCGATEAVLRKKVYQGAIDKTLKNNFRLVLKVGNVGGKIRSLPSHVD